MRDDKMTQFNTKCSLCTAVRGRTQCMQLSLRDQVLYRRDMGVRQKQCIKLKRRKPEFPTKKFQYQCLHSIYVKTLCNIRQFQLLLVSDSLDHEERKVYGMLHLKFHSKFVYTAVYRPNGDTEIQTFIEKGRSRPQMKKYGAISFNSMHVKLIVDIQDYCCRQMFLPPSNRLSLDPQNVPSIRRVTLNYECKQLQRITQILYTALNIYFT